MTIELEWESKKFLWMRYIGNVTGRELLDKTLKIGGDPRFDDLRYILSDWTETTKANVSTEDVKELVAYVTAMAGTNSNIMNASTMSKDETGQALVAFYQHLSKDLPWQMKFFTENETARNWFRDAVNTKSDWED